MFRSVVTSTSYPASGLAVLVLRARSSRVPDLLAVVPPLLVALSGAAPGTVTELRGA
jgi:hypothetical protein